MTLPTPSHKTADFSRLTKASAIALFCTVCYAALLHTLPDWNLFSYITN
ncbi:MAG: hypothetical protein RMX96_19715 [Nostoc sp. ChiSLP02]|nr:hypothetical protein [Nostoc sp. ChiSLP02]